MKNKFCWTKTNVYLSEPASHPLLQDDRYLALLLDELDGWIKPQEVNIFTDIVRLYAWSSTPIWNMSSKQWRRTKRGALSLDWKDVFTKQNQQLKAAASDIDVHHVLRYMSLLLFSIVLAHDAIWFSDVYRRPSIKTVYEPMPDDRPRCSRVWIMGLLSLFLLRIPSSRDRLCLSGQPLRTSFDSRDIFHAEYGKDLSYWSSAFLVIFSLYHTLKLKRNWAKVLDSSLLCLRSTMSILRRNTGGKVHPSDIDEVRGSKDWPYCTFSLNRRSITMQRGWIGWVSISTSEW